MRLCLVNGKPTLRVARPTDDDRSDLSGLPTIETTT